MKVKESIKILKGSVAICRYVQEDPNQILYLIEHEGLPAWKRNKKGPWRAINIDLQDWVVFQRKKYLRDTAKFIKKSVNLIESR